MERYTTVHHVAHVRVRRVGVGSVCHLSAQGNWKTAWSQVLRGSSVLNTLMGWRVRRGAIHDPMAWRNLRVHHALSA